MKKIVVGYHGYCMDGIGALAVMYHRFGKENIVGVPLDHTKKERSFQSLIKAIEDNRGNITSIALLDFTFSFEMMAEIEDIAVEINSGFLLVDHHSGAKLEVDMLIGYSDSNGTDIVFDTTKSGALLTYEYYYDTPPPPVLEYLSDADCYTWKLPHSRDVSAMLNFLTGKQDVEELVVLFDKTYPELIKLATEEHVYAKEYLDKTVDLYFSGSKYVTLDIGGEKLDILLRPCDLAFASKIGELSTMGNFAIKAVVLYTGVGQIISCSVRSDKMINPGMAVKIAQHFGGNGHDNAGGFKIGCKEFCELFLK